MDIGEPGDRLRWWVQIKSRFPVAHGKRALILLLVSISADIFIATKGH